MSDNERLESIERSISPQPDDVGYGTDWYPNAHAGDVRWLIDKVRELTADSDYCATHFAECARGASAYRAGKTLADNPHSTDRPNSLFDDAWQTGWKAAAYDSLAEKTIDLVALQKRCDEAGDLADHSI